METVLFIYLFISILISENLYFLHNVNLFVFMKNEAANL